jgi:uncharacterized membrane protein YbhN (UPF0104 family)
MSERAPNTPEAGGPKRTLRLAIQLAGFLVGLGLLVWCAKLAFSEKNRAGLERLGDASVGEVSLLLALSCVGILVNGLTFWLVLRPVRRIELRGMLATNAVATFLSYLPFKLSVMMRVAVHRQRDGVPLALIGPWFAAVGVVMVSAVAPILLLAAWRHEVDAVWVLMLAGLLVIGAGALSSVAQLIGGQRGLRLVQRVADRQPIGLIRRLVRSEMFVLFDEGLAMLASFRQTLAAIGLRMIDIGAMAARFYVASRIVGSPLPAGESLVGSVAYFFIGVFSPVGALGAREGGTAGFISWIGEFDFETLALIAVVVTGAELIVTAFFAAAGIAWLRPDRLIRGATRAQPGGELSSADADRAGQPEPDDR